MIQCINPQHKSIVILFDHSFACRHCMLKTATHKNDWMHAAEIELVYKMTVKPSGRPIIRSSNDAAGLLSAAWDKDKIDFVEQFKILLLNTGHRVLGLVDISSGGVAGTLADIKLIFSAALKANATSIILSHNHPSGNPRPGKMDKQVTNRLQLAGELLDVKVIDHIIVSSEGYYSFADEGIINI